MTEPSQQQLKRLLGRSFSIAACVGGTIGLGILRTPGEIATAVQEPWLYMALWLGGGLFVLLSTLVAAELIALTPRSGGPYVLISRAYGPYPGFLLGWTDWLSQCASGALKAVVLMEYAALLVPGLAPYVMAGALLINSLFALFQLGGVRLSGGFLQFSAVVFGLILITVAVLLVFAGSDPEPVVQDPRILRAGPDWALYGIVAAGIVYTYDGWVMASYYGAEVDGGGRTAALGSLRGVMIVIFLYLLLNGALVANVPLTALEGHELALAGAMDYAYGAGAGNLIVLVALFILFAHQNIQYMTSSRTLYALSVDGLGSRRATTVSNRGTPSGAVLTSWFLMALLILAGGFEFLLNLSALLFMVLYVALMVGVIRLRRRAPDAERPFRAWGYPLTAWLSAGGWMVIAVFVALMDPRSALYSVVLTAVSIPVFLGLRARRGLSHAR